MAVLSPPIQNAIRFNSGYLRAKRFLDVLITLFLSPFIGLVMILVVILIRLDSEGPIFYRQKRVGQDGVEFEMIKFRSMTVNKTNDDSFHRNAIKQYMNGEMLNGNDKAATSTSTMLKVVDESRITRVGRIIRKTSIDELPQFLNVLRGEMSLVGPRPPLVYEVEEYTARENLRLLGKPGLTGTWQVYGRSRVPFGEMVDMDISYLQQQSTWLDLKLIVLTVPVMILGRGGG
ncbi:MAG TPA: sugar transferase [Ktedonobacteraceae bacterium]|nr:sugar transferase [Ktedonobacteraceae bacterium]